MLNALMQLTVYYQVEGELEEAVNKSIESLMSEGCIIEEAREDE